MIKIVVDTYEELLSAKGIVNLGCEKCKDAMKTGHGNPKNCEKCTIKEVVYYTEENSK